MNILKSILVCVALTAAAHVVVASPALAGRTHRDIVRPDVEWAVRQDIGFTTLQRGPYGDWVTPVLLAARSEREWTTAMATLASRGELIVSQVPKPPAVNWARQMVVLIALGQLDGYSVEITRVSRMARGLYLDARIREARRSGDVDVSPFHLIVLNSKPPGDLTALYDWSMPGLPTSPTSLISSPVAATDVVGRAPAQSVNSASTRADELPAPAMTWGRLKSLYRQ